MPDADANEELEDIVVKKSKLPLILMVVGGIVVGMGGGFFLFGGSSETPESESAENGSEGGEDGEDAVLPYTTYNLGLFTVNLRGTGGGRVLRMEISLKVDTSLEATMDERKDELRHHIITMVSDYSYTDLDGLDGKNRLAAELLMRINRLMGNDRVDALFFAQFVVQ